MNQSNFLINVTFSTNQMKALFVMKFIEKKINKTIIFQHSFNMEVLSPESHNYVTEINHHSEEKTLHLKSQIHRPDGSITWEYLVINVF